MANDNLIRLVLLLLSTRQSPPEQENSQIGLKEKMGRREVGSRVLRFSRIGLGSCLTGKVTV